MEEHNRHIDYFKVEGLKGGRMYNRQERVFQFAAEVIPIQWGPGPPWHGTISDGETLQGTEWESEKGNKRYAIQELIRYDSNTSDKGLNDRIFDKDLMKPFTGLTTCEIKIREEMFATGEEE